MKLNGHTAKFVAFLFLIMLGQKSGAGLLLHNLFHTSDFNESAKSKTDNKAISYACNCIDDFSLPLEEPADIISPASIIYKNELISFCPQTAPAAFYLFNSLRAPPAFVA